MIETKQLSQVKHHGIPMDLEAPIIIQSSTQLSMVNPLELWEYRELLYFLVWRDLKVRYKQTFLGVMWAVIQPLLAMLVFTLFFGKLGKIPSDGVPYPIFAYTGLLLWQLFSRALTDASTSLVTNERIVTKVYFPRILIPMSAILSSLVDFGISFVLLIVMMLIYRVSPGWQILTFPLFLVWALLTSSSVAIWLCSLDIQYRDIRYTLPFITQFWLFITPVAYPSSLVPAKWRWLYGINPMTGVVEGARYALLGKPLSSGYMMLVSAFMVLLLLFTGLLYFKKVERTLADII